MHATDTEPGTTSLRPALLEDHARLERALDELANAAEGALPDELIAVWRRFETGLRAHLATEEEHLFPLVVGDPELGEIEADHAEIRRQLDELGLAVELHAVREERIDALVELLRAHAEHENAWLYAIADRRLEAAKRRTVLDRLRALARD
ncbi:MAG: hemerythrin domain-containing protein [Myxococcales bacterium]|nr:hemerythrin domain-containing protein [Myxococcales bacterium]